MEKEANDDDEEEEEDEERVRLEDDQEKIRLVEEDLERVRPEEDQERVRAEEDQERVRLEEDQERVRLEEDLERFRLEEDNEPLEGAVGGIALQETSLLMERSAEDARVKDQKEVVQETESPGSFQITELGYVALNRRDTGFPPILTRQSEFFGHFNCVHDLCPVENTIDIHNGREDNTIEGIPDADLPFGRTIVIERHQNQRKCVFDHPRCRGQGEPHTEDDRRPDDEVEPPHATEKPPDIEHTQTGTK